MMTRCHFSVKNGQMSMEIDMKTSFGTENSIMVWG